MNTSTIILLALVAFIVWSFSAIPGNVRKARTTGLPVYITFANPASPGWLICSAIFGWAGLKKYLPVFVFDRVKVAIVGWEFHCRHEMSTKLGRSFIAVTTGPIMLFTVEPELSNAVLTRRKDFIRVAIATKILGRFGPNVFSEENETWQRHRRIVAPVLNERIMDAVWRESTSQAKQMMRAFFNPKDKSDYQEGETDETVSGLKTITVNVIASAAFGTSIPWTSIGTEQPAPPGYKMGFVKGIATIVNNFFVAVLLPTSVLSFFAMPESMKTVGTAATEFPLHAKDIISKERQSGSPKNSLLNALIKIADQDESREARLSKTSTYLSEEELVGNLFIFILAGFDTTANTLAYAVMLLTIYPEWQDWIIAGIDQADKANASNSYDPTWTILTRLRALMFETLRVCTPIPHVARIADDNLTVGSVFIPKDTIIQVSSAVVHVSPDHWGPDPLVFRPSRWCTGPNADGIPASETLLEPSNCTFLPWSTGPRYCPGMKMAQVEFVAVIREIFSKYKVEPVTQGGETLQMARDRLNRVLLDSSPKMTLQIKNAEDVVLRWKPRSNEH